MKTIYQQSWIILKDRLSFSENNSSFDTTKDQCSVEGSSLNICYILVWQIRRYDAVTFLEEPKLIPQTYWWMKIFTLQLEV